MSLATIACVKKTPNLLTKYNHYHPELNWHNNPPTSHTVDCYLQSWKLFIHKEQELRKIFRFRSVWETAAKQEMQKHNIPADATLVGVHVRRGDVLEDLFRYYGYTAAPVEYVKTAMNYFMAKYTKIHFVVVSNDVPWCKENLSDHVSHERIHFTSTDHPVVAMAILASCHHVIITVGTFGWWAAWLANGETIYYSNWQIGGSPLSRVMTLKNYFWPGWIGL